MVFTAFGLSIASEFDLRDISRAPTAALGQSPDVTIADGPVPKALVDSIRVGKVLEKNSEHVLLRVANVADFLISNGNRIVVSRNSSCVPDTLETYLFGSVFGILLQQRGVFSLHVGAVETHRGLIAFCGPSGTGKSTMVSELHRQTGCPVFCDDVASVSMVDGVPLLHPGVARIKLCRDALLRLGISEVGLVRDHTGRDKYKLPLVGKEGTTAKPLIALFGLFVGPATACIRLSGTTAFSLTHSAFYRSNLFDLFERRIEAARLSARIASVIPIYRFERQWTSDASLDPILEII